MGKKIAYFLNIVRTKIIEYKWKKASKESTINGICLVFHHVSEDTIDTLASCQCTTKSFVNIIEKLKEEGYNIVSLEDFKSIVSQHSNKKFVLITFDDVPEDMYINAYPYLKENHIPFTVFITTGFIDKKGYLSSEQLESLNKDPLCTIGAHTISHPLLRFNKDKRIEIVECGNILERIIGKPIGVFAYPFGSLYSTDRCSVRLAKERYELAFSTIESNLNDYTVHKTLFLPRIAISDFNQINLVK